MGVQNNETIIPVILCGGSGTRLWPVSREGLPKQFLSLLGSGTLLQETAERALRVTGAPEGNVVTVTLEALRPEVARQLSEISPAMARHVIGEPCARNTAAAVALAARYVEKTFGSDAFLWILAADHHMGDEAALAEGFRSALATAKEGYLSTFGITPTRPETGYGYIRLGAGLPADPQARAIDRFVEKPDRATAQGYLDSGEYLWNSGMFLFRADTVLDNFQTHAAEILAPVDTAMERGANATSVCPQTYSAIPESPFDIAIMEKTARAAVVPCNPAWSDIGSFESLWEIREKDPNGNVLDGLVAAHDSRDCLVLAQDRLVACVGVKDLVVAETGDCILVADKANSDALKVMVKALKKSGRREISEPVEKSQDWGKVKTLSSHPDRLVREIAIAPGHSLPPLIQNGNGAFWTFTEGTGIIAVNGRPHSIGPGASLFIAPETAYAISCTSTVPLQAIEIRLGDTNAEDRPVIASQQTTERAAA